MELLHAIVRIENKKNPCARLLDNSMGKGDN
jgi:hypothetical protein